MLGQRAIAFRELPFLGSALPLLPRNNDAASTAVYVQSVLSGERPTPGPVLKQVELIRAALATLQLQAQKAGKNRVSAAASPGWCALVGAGPGNPVLLTLQALRTLRQATVLLVDDLVSYGVLALALKGSQRRRLGPPRVIHVGKRGGCTSTPQAFIERLMVQHARAGERVVRLKCGDPFVFGRGGEEAQALRAAGVEVRVVHGITSGLVAASQLGVPWTHSDHAHGVMLVTGQAREGNHGPDWTVLGAAAAHGLTLVIYMGMARLAALQAGLLQALPPHTPRRCNMPAHRRNGSA